MAAAVAHSNVGQSWHCPDNRWANRATSLGPWLTVISAHHILEPISQEALSLAKGAAVCQPGPSGRGVLAHRRITVGRMSSDGELGTPRSAPNTSSRAALLKAVKGKMVFGDPLP